MPIPKPNEGETQSEFMDRCMSDETMVSEYPDEKQRYAVCVQQSKKEVDKLSIIFKSLPVEVKANSSGNLMFKISTNMPDRDSDIVEPRGVRLDNYRMNPIVLFAHDYQSLPIGRSLREVVYDDYIESEVEFAPTAFAQDCKKLCENGFLNAASIGFVGHSYEPIEGSKYGKRYTDWELLEWSIVPVPSNAASLIQNAKAKGINLDAIEKELNQMDQKSVIPYKSYPTEPESTEWDGPAEIAAASVEDLKIMCAWYDSENADTKQAYKLPHHRQSDKHVIWRGVRAAMGALLGARDGADIPEADRKDVYNHLVKEYKNFDKEPPEFKEYTDVELKAMFPEEVKEAGLITKTPDTEGNPSTYDIEREIQNTINPSYVMPGVWVVDLYPVNYPSGKVVICRQSKYFIHNYVYEKVNDVVKITLDEGIEVEIAYSEKALQKLKEWKSGATLSAKNRELLNSIHDNLDKCRQDLKAFIDSTMPMEPGDMPMMTAMRTAPASELAIKVELSEEFKKALEEIKSQVLLLSQKSTEEPKNPDAAKDQEIDLDAIELPAPKKDPADIELNIEPGELKNMIQETVKNLIQGGS